jgi:hypothetical protein
MDVIEIQTRNFPEDIDANKRKSLPEILRKIKGNGQDYRC